MNTLTSPCEFQEYNRKKVLCFDNVCFCIMKHTSQQGEVSQKFYRTFEKKQGIIVIIVIFMWNMINLFCDINNEISTEI